MATFPPGTHGAAKCLAAGCASALAMHDERVVQNVVLHSAIITLHVMLWSQMQVSTE